MNRLSIEDRIQIIAALVEGNSVRATCRMTNAAKGTVLRLLADVGQACAEYQDKTLRNLPLRRVQCDEIWSFCYAKEKNVPEEARGVLGFGDVWTWTALCADTKLVPSWLVGRRDAFYAYKFIEDLAGRLKGRIQLTTVWRIQTDPLPGGEPCGSPSGFPSTFRVREERAEAAPKVQS